MRIRIEKKGWFEFFDDLGGYLSTTFIWKESLGGYEVVVNDSGLMRGYYLGQILGGPQHYFFLPAAGIEIEDQK